MLNEDGTTSSVPGRISIAHEFRHALNAMKGIMKDQFNDNYEDVDIDVNKRITDEEINVRIFENLIRSEQGIKQRATPKKVK